MTKPLLLAIAAIMIGVARTACALPGAGQVTSGPSNSAFVSTDLMAAFIVAYEDYRTLPSANGDASPQRLAREHYGITLTREDGNVARIVFFPAKPGTGGGFEYDVDLKEYSILKKVPTK